MPTRPAGYRYYVTRDASGGEPARPVSAHDVEQAVIERIRALLRDRNRIARLVLRTDAQRVDRAVAKAAAMAASPEIDISALGVARIDLSDRQLRITIAEHQLLRALDVACDDEHDGTVQLEADIQRVRQGHALRLVVAGDAPEPMLPQHRDEKLIALLAESVQARVLVLASPALPIHEIASRHQRCRKRLARLIRLSFLAPDIVRLILRGEQPASLDAAMPRCRSMPSCRPTGRSSALSSPSLEHCSAVPAHVVPPPVCADLRLTPADRGQRTSDQRHGPACGWQGRA